jgi:hypothetical protein
MLIILTCSWEVSWIGKDAAQPDRVEGFLRAPLAAIIRLMSDRGAQLRWKGQFGANPNTPCQHCLWEETGALGASGIQGKNRKNYLLNIEGTHPQGVKYIRLRGHIHSPFLSQNELVLCFCRIRLALGQSQSTKTEHEWIINYAWYTRKNLTTC